MFNYNIFLPEFSRRTVSDACAFLKEESIEAEISPKFDPGKKPPYKVKLDFAIIPTFVKGWSLSDDKILSSFNISVKPFDMRKLEESQKFSFGNLFKNKKGEESLLDIKKIKKSTDKSTLAKLGSCKYEITIEEDLNLFGSETFAPLFAVAFTIAGRGMLYEGEFAGTRKQIMEDYFPNDIEFDELIEDIEDGKKPLIFERWP